MSTLYENRKPIASYELLNVKRDDIDIPDHTSIKIGPEEPNYSHLFHKIEVKTFKDLEILKLIPIDLSEEKVLKSIEEDNNLTLEMVRSSFKFEAKTCNCQKGEHSQSSINPQNQFRRAYNSLRKSNHFKLAEVLSSHNNKQTEWDSFIVHHTYKWVKQILTNAIDINALFANDIIIGKNSTMTVLASTNSLMARDIKIYWGGRMEFLGNYININCNSAQGHLQIRADVIKL